VRYVLDDGSGRAALAPLLPTVARADLDVYRDATAWPRAFFVAAVVPHDDAKALAARVLAGDGRAFAGVAVEDLRRPEWQSVPQTQNPVPGIPARRVMLLPNATRVQIDAPSAGLAVLHEAWLDGDLEVTRNGAPAPALRVNHAFAGVVLPNAGLWELEFRHRPRAWTLSLRLAAAGIVLLSGTLLWIGLRQGGGAAKTAR
jgi:hypothetical protein